MRLSQLFTKTSKTSQADNDSKNADLLTRAGFIHKTMAGAYSYLPLGLRTLRNIERIVREEMNAIGGQELLLSALAPRDNWEATGRWDAVDVLFKVPAAGGSEYALNPTHEEIITPLAKQFVSSYKDLPFAAYQIQTKFRNEPRAKSGVMRGREFIMKDLYSFHASQADLDRYYDEVTAAYIRIFDRLGIGEQTYLTFASGGTFSKYSHEFQTVIESGEDTIYISEAAAKVGKRVAVNKEIFEPSMPCPLTGEATEWRETRASEVGNIFKLGTKFSAAFDLAVQNETGERITLVMGCYGIGVSRLLGVVTETLADEAGLVWPASIAPAQIQLVTAGKNPETKAKAEQIYSELSQKFEVIFDDREAGFGAKMADADLIGCPIRVLVSDKSLENAGAEVKMRSSKDATIVKLENLAGELSNWLNLN